VVVVRYYDLGDSVKSWEILRDMTETLIGGYENVNLNNPLYLKENPRNAIYEFSLVVILSTITGGTLFLFLPRHSRAGPDVWFFSLLSFRSSRRSITRAIINEPSTINHINNNKYCTVVRSWFHSISICYLCYHHTSYFLFDFLIQWNFLLLLLCFVLAFALRRDSLPNHWQGMCCYVMFEEKEDEIRLILVEWLVDRYALQSATNQSRMIFIRMEFSGVEWCKILLCATGWFDCLQFLLLLLYISHLFWGVVSHTTFYLWVCSVVIYNN